jgi:glycosyltransferase involved in cell wall biosynthesis
MRPPIAAASCGSKRRRLTNASKVVILKAALYSGACARLCLLCGAASRFNPLGPLFADRDDVAWCSDPAESVHSAREQRLLRKGLGVHPEELVFLIIGRLSPRKGVDIALEAWRQLAPQERPLLMLVGAVHPDLTPTLTDAWAEELLASGRLIVRDKYLDSDVFDGYIAAADCIILAYSNEAPSGIFGKARAAGVPLLIAGNSYLGEEVAHARGGIVVSSDPLDVAGGVRKVVANLPALRKDAWDSRLTGGQSESRFAQTLLGPSV